MSPHRQIDSEEKERIFADISLISLINKSAEKHLIK